MRPLGDRGKWITSDRLCDESKRSSDLSTTFARFIDLLGIPNYTANPIISDEGSAFQAYASRIGAEHFHCEMNAAVKRH
jgi:hypothetical protein